LVNPYGTIEEGEERSRAMAAWSQWVEAGKKGGRPRKTGRFSGAKPGIANDIDILRSVIKSAKVAFGSHRIRSLTSARLHQLQHRSDWSSARRCVNAGHTGAPNVNRFELAGGPAAAPKLCSLEFAEGSGFRRWNETLPAIAT
jgi:hypothetical protein